MSKHITPICKICSYMKLTGYCAVNRNNRGNPRGSCFCEHPDAEETFYKVCPHSPRMAKFIGFTVMGGNVPQLKSSPRWCPLRMECEETREAADE